MLTVTVNDLIRCYTIFRTRYQNNILAEVPGVARGISKFVWFSVEDDLVRINVKSEESLTHSHLHTLWLLFQMADCLMIIIKIWDTSWSARCCPWNFKKRCFKKSSILKNLISLAFVTPKVTMGFLKKCQPILFSRLASYS